jgi:hypothetical protein
MLRLCAATLINVLPPTLSQMPELYRVDIPVDSHLPRGCSNAALGRRLDLADASGKPANDDAEYRRHALRGVVRLCIAILAIIRPAPLGFLV